MVKKWRGSVSRAGRGFRKLRGMNLQQRQAANARTTGFQRSAFSSEDVRPRRANFVFPPGIARHWLKGSPVKTHLLNSLNLFLPAFERMIVRNIKDDILPRIADEHLRNQAKGLVAQEALHSKAHSLFLHNLRAQGYRIDGYLRISEWFFGRVMARCAPRTILSAIASFEHYTDLLVRLFEETDFLDGCDPHLRELMLWHAAEEVEHHAIPLQLLRALGAGYLLRQAGNLLGLTIIVAFMAGGTATLLRQDRLLLRFASFREMGEILFGRYRLLPNAARLFAMYLRPGYRPEDNVDRSNFARRVLE